MNRTSGTGLIGLGVVLVVAGAIMYWGLTVSRAAWFNLNNIGLILFWAGLVSFVIGMFVMLIGGRSSTSTREETHTTPGGYERSEEQDEWRNIA